jgi:hypothetical protein
MPITGIEELIASAKQGRVTAITGSAHCSRRGLLRPVQQGFEASLIRSDFGLKQFRREIVQFAENVRNNFRKLRREKL